MQKDILWKQDVKLYGKCFVNLIRVNVHYPRALSSRFSYKALKTQALRLKNDGVPVYGLGLQGHFSSHNIDIDVLKVIDLH